jgi:hypothetical protein
MSPRRPRSDSDFTLFPDRFDFLGLYANQISTWGQHLCCPICGLNCNHLEAVAINRGGSVVEIRGNRPPAEIASLPTGRGSSIWIDLICECGHLWTLRYQFHKGVVSFEFVSRGGSSPDEHVEEFWRD